MRWKPNDTEIIDYLYGELTPDKAKKFAKHLAENESFAKEVNDLRATLGLLAEVPDEEVIPPLPIRQEDSPGKTQGSRRWLYPVSIAASLAAIIIVGYITKLNISISNEGFHLGFNNPPPAVETFSKEELLGIIDNKVELAANEFYSGMAAMQTNFTAQLQENKKLTEAEIKRVAATRAKTSIDDEQILAFIAQLQVENKKAMQTFYQISAKEQQKYMRSILLDFNEYLNEQRQKDLQFIQANILELKSTSALKQEETDKILASIITTVNNQNSIGR